MNDIVIHSMPHRARDWAMFNGRFEAILDLPEGSPIPSIHDLLTVELSGLPVPGYVIPMRVISVEYKAQVQGVQVNLVGVTDDRRR